MLNKVLLLVVAGAAIGSAAAHAGVIGARNIFPMEGRSQMLMFTSVVRRHPGLMCIQMAQQSQAGATCSPMARESPTGMGSLMTARSGNPSNQIIRPGLDL